MKKLSDMANRLEGQKMFQVLAKTQELERQGKEIIHFEIGDPDFDTPKNIKDSVYEALKKGYTHYASSSGLLELKVAAADVTLNSRGFKPDLNQLLVTPGANYQIHLACRFYFEFVFCMYSRLEQKILPQKLKLLLESKQE